MKTLEFKRLDLVRLINGSEIIITEVIPSRPANPYLGVKPRGNGRQYKFGHKFCPVKIGTVTESHPAIRALQERRGASITPYAKYAIEQLLDAVEKGDLAGAKTLAVVVRDNLS